MNPLRRIRHRIQLTNVENVRVLAKTLKHLLYKMTNVSVVWTPYTDQIVSQVHFVYLFLTYSRAVLRGTDIPGWIFSVREAVKNIQQRYDDNDWL